MHADICNLGSGFLVADYKSFVQSPGTLGQNMKPNRLCHILNSSICKRNYCFFSKNLFLVNNIIPYLRKNI